MPLKVLGFDVGFNLGWGVVQHDGPVSSGTIKIPGSVINFGLSMFEAEKEIRQVVARVVPRLIIVAEPWVQHSPPPTATALRPIMAFEGLVEKIGYEAGIEVIEENEARVRGYFKIPSRPHIKKNVAVAQYCAAMGWPADSEHSGDALVMAAYGLGLRVPDRQHELLPMFRKRRAA